MPDLILDRPGGTDPEHEALLADSVGVALLVVLDTLSAAERLAFVLHDIFAVPFDEIAPIVDRSPRRPASWPAGPAGASRASRPSPTSTSSASARWSTRSWPLPATVTSTRSSPSSTPTSSSAPTRGRGGRGGRGRRIGSGARCGQVARRAMVFAQIGLLTHPALVNGVAGAVTTRDGSPSRSGAFTVRGGKVVALDILADPDRLRTLDLTVLGA